MTILFSGNMSTGATDNITLSGNTQSMEILNLSHFDLQISSDTMGSWKLPARCTKTYSVQPNDYIQFTLADNPFQPTALTGEYIQATQSTEATETGITPLSMIPAFSTDVTVDGGVNASITGPVNLAAGTQVQATLAAGSTVNLAQGAQVQANLAAGSQVAISGNVTVQEILNGVNSNITNQVLSSSQTVYAGRSTYNVNNLASGQAIGNLNSPQVDASLYDGCMVIVQSSGGYDYISPAANDSPGITNGYYNQNSNPVTVTKFPVSAFSGSVIGFTLTYGIPIIAIMQYFGLQNNTPNTIVSDSLTIDYYFIRASVGTSLSPVQSQTIYTNKSLTLCNGLAISGSNVPANGGYGTLVKCTTDIPANVLKRARIYIQVTNASGFTANGVGVEVELIGGESTPVANNTWVLNTNNSSMTLYASGNYTMDSESTPSLKAGYSYLTFAARIYNGSGATASASCNVTIYAYWQE